MRRRIPWLTLGVALWAVSGVLALLMGTWAGALVGLALLGVATLVHLLAQLRRELAALHQVVAHLAARAAPPVGEEAFTDGAPLDAGSGARRRGGSAGVCRGPGRTSG